jgi:cell division protein FtsI (penicillin-binding protein 3)
MNISSKVRSTLIFILFVGFYLAVVVNLYFIQIVQTNFFSALANRQYHIELTNLPKRGRILDRYGQPVAINKESVSAFVLPRQVRDEEGLKSFLQEYFPPAWQRFESYRNKHFMYVSRRFPPDLCNHVQCSHIVDLKFMKEPSRYYPNEAMGQIVGTTNIDNKGLFGIEKLYNKALSGKPTKVVLEKDARSAHYYFKRELQKNGQAGSDIKLTIDSDLQYLVSEVLANAVERFEAEMGATIVMDPSNGDILSIVSVPNFDPNNIQKSDLAKAKLVPITDAYEFGSIMKIFVAMAAFTEGVVEPDEIIDCENKRETAVDGMKFTTVVAHGKIPFSEVVARSNNIGMVKVAKRLGPKLYDYYKRFGFGAKTGIKFLGEQSGYVSHPSKWSRRSIISLSFGYELTATLLQAARAFSVIANGGYLVTPKLILDKDTPAPQKVYDAEIVTIAQNILRDAVHHGTGVRAKIKGYDVMGKTGTANLVVDGKYSDRNKIFSFVGIVQKGNYSRVIATCIKNTKKARMYGSNTAAPTFERIAEQMLVHDKVV